jgi:hypothetical protein
VLGDTLGLAGDGAHQDQAATDLEVLVGLTGDEELASGVDAEDTVELLGGDILDVAEGDDTRVGADNVDLAPDLDGLVEEGDDLVDVGDVGLDGDSLGAGLLDHLTDLLGRLDTVGIVDNDLGTTATKLLGHLTANTTTCCWILVRVPKRKLCIVLWGWGGGGGCRSTDGGGRAQPHHQRQAAESFGSGKMIQTTRETGETYQRR